MKTLRRLRGNYDYTNKVVKLLTTLCIITFCLGTVLFGVSLICNFGLFWLIASFIPVIALSSILLCKIFNRQKLYNELIGHIEEMLLKALQEASREMEIYDMTVRIKHVESYKFVLQIYADLTYEEVQKKLRPTLEAMNQRLKNSIELFYAIYPK